MTQTIEATIPEETYRRLLQLAHEQDRNLNEIAGAVIQEAFTHE